MYAVIRQTKDLNWTEIVTYNNFEQAKRLKYLYKLASPKTIVIIRLINGGK